MAGSTTYRFYRSYVSLYFCWRILSSKVYACSLKAWYSGFHIKSAGSDGCWSSPSCHIWSRKKHISSVFTLAGSYRFCCLMDVNPSSNLALWPQVSNVSNGFGTCAIVKRLYMIYGFESWIHEMSNYWESWKRWTNLYNHAELK